MESAIAIICIVIPYEAILVKGRNIEPIKRADFKTAYPPTLVRPILIAFGEIFFKTTSLFVLETSDK